MEKNKKKTIKKTNKTSAKKKPISKKKVVKKKTSSKKVIKKTKKKATKKKKKVVNLKKRYANVGRKQFDGRIEDVLNKLEYAFCMGCTDEEACLYANIDPRVLYKYQEKNIEFVHRKEQLKKTPILKAREKIVDNIESSVSTAQWYIERKNKHEFATSQNLNHSGNIDSNVNLGITKDDAIEMLEGMQKKINEMHKGCKNGKKIKSNT